MNDEKHPNSQAGCLSGMHAQTVAPRRFGLSELPRTGVVAVNTCSIKVANVNIKRLELNVCMAIEASSF